ncbi:ScbA/BarX family gamma-butyrolactone biosynthesis protein [Catenuloplanes sp. NPDC051500]|uniref:ScbA/BarX family gamma-butyrolactone biosynthesis protein n=1 Tax=Catenuloplanes sp. NPDC051500 TaxID=3363959 RepID=UPI0037B56B48
MTLENGVSVQEHGTMTGLLPGPRTALAAVLPATLPTVDTVADAGVQVQPRPLTYDAPVSRHLVHRASIAEVFVTDSVALDDENYLVAAQLPRGHAIGENGTLYDFQILVEAVRQAGVLIAHEHLGIDLETPFIFRGLDLEVLDLARLQIGASPGVAVIRTSVQVERTGAGRLRGLSFRGGVDLDGEPAVEGSGRLLFVTKGSYQALRKRGRESKLALNRPTMLPLNPAAPASVGRHNPRNVVITEPVPLGDRRIGASLVIDRRHPYLFDHPLDHVPGNLSLEACRQAALAAVGREYGLAVQSLTITGFAVEFGEFAETDLLTRLTAQVGELSYDDRRGVVAAPVVVELTQAGTALATAKVQVAAWV